MIVENYDNHVCTVAWCHCKTLVIVVTASADIPCLVSSGVFRVVSLQVVQHAGDGRADAATPRRPDCDRLTPLNPHGAQAATGSLH